MRFLHIADVHLDSPFVGRSDTLRQRLRRGAREAFRKGVDLAREEELHAVLVAGDLLDGDRLSFATERFLLDQMTRLHEAGIQVVYATGNHDPGRTSERVRSLSWPSNVTVAGEAEPRRIPVAGPEGRVVGRVTAAGHPGPRETRDLAATFPPPPGDVPEVALLHTQVRESPGGESHHPYAPSTLEGLRSTGFDYWALGHVHLRQALSESPPIHYPGSLQGRSPRETGPKGGLVVELSEREPPIIEFRELAPVRWESLTVNGLGAAGTLEAVETRIRDAWRRARRDDPGSPDSEWVLRIELAGSCPLWRELSREENLRTLGREMERALGVLSAEVRAGGVHPVVEPEEHRDRKDVLGALLRRMEAIRDGRADPPELEPDELAGPVSGEDPERVREYLRELLSDAEGELLARMRSREG